MAVEDFTPEVKICTCCNIEKNVSEFYRRSDQRGKYRSHCKQCTEERTNKQERADRAKNWRELNQDRARELSKAWRAAHLDYEALRWRFQNSAMKENNRRGYLKHRTKRLVNQAKYASARKIEISAYMARWWKRNTEKAAAYHNGRRAAKRNAEGSHTAEDIRHLFNLQRGKCACCRVRLKRQHVDHITALVRGGSNGRTNLQLLCPTCNLRKSAKHPIDFMQENGFLL